MNRSQTLRITSITKGALIAAALALFVNLAAPVPSAQAGLLGGALGGAVLGGIIGGRRGAGVGAVVGGVAGAVRSGDRRRAARNYERRELAYDQRRLEAERRYLRKRR